MSQYGLGRGLDALIARKKAPVVSPPPLETVSASPPPASGLFLKKRIGSSASQPMSNDEETVYQIPIDKIDSNEYQPRQDFENENLQELADSIRQYGILQPVLVQQEGERYRLIAGERRVRAAKLVGLATVSAIIREAVQQKRLEMALIENIQRVDLSPIEIALAYKRLVSEFNLTHHELGQRLGVSRPHVANMIRLLKLPQEMQDAAREKKITFREARVLLQIDDPEERKKFFNDLVAGKYRKRAVDIFARQISKKEYRPRSSTDPTIMHKELLLREYLGTRVAVWPKKGGGGTVMIDFFTSEELADICFKILHHDDFS